MIRRLLVCMMVVAASPAFAQKGGFDATGWTLLGSQNVKGKHDHDTIAVGKNEGRFDELQMVVTDADIKLKQLTVVFANGQRWSPKLSHVFKEGQRSRAIDLPGDDRTIAKIDLAYSAAAPGSMAEVSIYARDRRGKAAPEFNRKGWTRLGAGVVNGARDHDVVPVGAKKGGFDQLTMLVLDSDLALSDLTIVFADGKKWSPKLKHTFKEGAASHVIDLPGKDRRIARFDLVYANTPGGGNAKVEIYGRDVGRPAPPLPAPVTWEKKGWTFLGKKTVDGWRDRDHLVVSQAKPFSAVMFVVTGSDVKLDKVMIALGNNEKFEAESNVTFKEGARTSPIDIPGKLRKIKSVDFAYSNLPGGGRATVEVWGRAK